MNNKFAKILSLVQSFVVAVMTLSCTPDSGSGEVSTPPDIIENNGVGADGKITLDNMLVAYYLGNVWDNGIADYYVALSNDTIGQGSQGFEVPMHQGGWLLYLDLWSVLSEDTSNAILPEGTYTFGDSRGLGCFYNEYSLATNNREQVLVDGEWFYDIKDVYFKSGTVIVKHIDKGYHITVDVVTTTDETLSFVYSGPIVFDDQSDDEEWTPALEQDVTLVPEKVTMYKYAAYEAENCDNYVIMLFNVQTLTDDGLHPNVVGGMKLMLDLYPEYNKGVAGTYRVGTLSDDKYLLQKEPWVYYPGCYWGGMALGSFLEYVDTDASVLYSVIKSGEVVITDNGDGTHTIVVDTVSERGKSVKCNWTGVIYEHNSTASDMVMVK